MLRSLRHRHSFPLAFHVLVLVVVSVLSAQALAAGAAKSSKPQTESPKTRSAPVSTERRAFYWKGSSFRSAAGLRREVLRRGGDWEQFLRGHPGVVRAFRMSPVLWDARAFYSRDGLARWLGTRGARYGRWETTHRVAARRLHRNGIAPLARSGAAVDKTPAASPTNAGRAPEAAPSAGTGGTPASTPTPAPAASGTPTVNPTSPTAVSATAVSPSAKERIGVSSGGGLVWYDNAKLARELDGYVAIGAKWLRFDMHWAVIERQGKGVYDWAAYDRVVEQAAVRGLNVLAGLNYTPAWARNAACRDSDKCEPVNVQDYADFAAAVVRRYAGRVKHFELWNEPNIRQFWLPAPNPQKYAQLIAAAYPRMKAVDPSITVLAGATAPAPNDGVNVEPRTFLQLVYANGGGGKFDAWSHHPYFGPNRPSAAYEWSAWYQMYGTRPSLRSLMEANGDGNKKIWATETGSQVGVTWDCCGTTTEQRQAELLKEAFDLWRSYPWAGGLMIYNYNGEGGWSLTRDDWSPRPVWHAFRDYN